MKKLADAAVFAMNVTLIGVWVAILVFSLVCAAYAAIVVFGWWAATPAAVFALALAWALIDG